MNSQINEGDRVRVTRYDNGYERGTYYATALGWTPSGRLRVKADDGSQTTVNPDHVKKISTSKPSNQ